MINNKQRFSQRLISMMYNVKNFLTRVINVRIGKATLLYFFVNIFVLLISMILLYNIRSKNEQFYTILFIVFSVSLFSLLLFTIGKVIFIILYTQLNKKERQNMSTILIIAFTVAIFVIIMFFDLAFKMTMHYEFAVEAMEKIWLNLFIPFLIAPILFYKYTKYKERNDNQVLFIKNFRIMKVNNTEKNAIVIQNFNTISICDAHIYQKVDDKNKFICCKCFEPNQAIECELDDQAKEVSILLSDDSGDFKVGRKNIFKLDFLEGFDYNSGSVRELELEELMNYPLFRRNISAKAILFDIKSTLINQKFAYEAQWAKTIAELQQKQQAEGENTENPIKSITVTDIRETLRKYSNLESDEQINAMTKELGIKNLGEYNYKKEKKFRGISSTLSELYRDNKIIICAIAYGDKSGIERFKKSYLASLFRGRIFEADTSVEAMKDALKAISIDPEDCVMIGDSVVNDMIPAKNLGMQTIRVKQGLNAEVVSEDNVADREIDKIKNIRYEINF